MTAINSAVEVDLTGQVCADSIGHHLLSGVGGQMDFIRGAALAEDGRAIIALPSTAARRHLLAHRRHPAPGRRRRHHPRPRRDRGHRARRRRPRRPQHPRARPRPHRTGGSALPRGAGAGSKGAAVDVRGERQKAKGKRQKAKGKRQKAKKHLETGCESGGGRGPFCLLIFAFCLLVFLLPSPVPSQPNFSRRNSRTSSISASARASGAMRSKPCRPPSTISRRCGAPAAARRSAKRVACECGHQQVARALQEEDRRQAGVHVLDRRRLRQRCGSSSGSTPTKSRTMRRDAGALLGAVERAADRSADRAATTARSRFAVGAQARAGDRPDWSARWRAAAPDGRRPNRPTGRCARGSAPSSSALVDGPVDGVEAVLERIGVGGLPAPAGSRSRPPPARPRRDSRPTWSGPSRSARRAPSRRRGSSPPADGGPPPAGR